MRYYIDKAANVASIISVLGAILGIVLSTNLVAVKIAGIVLGALFALAMLFAAFIWLFPDWVILNFFDSFVAKKVCYTRRPEDELALESDQRKAIKKKDEELRVLGNAVTEEQWSFYLVYIFVIVGLLLIVFAIIWEIATKQHMPSGISAIGGLMTEFFAGTALKVRSQSLGQLREQQKLAQQARLELIKSISPPAMRAEAAMRELERFNSNY